MGRIDQLDGLKAAARYARAKDLQQKRSTEEGQARMLDSRRDLMLASGRVFFESIIEGSDLLPIRYLEMGQIAARAVGRIHLPSVDDRGSGFATGFLVAPGLLLTNHHVIPTAASALSATLTMDAQDLLSGLPSTPRVFQLDPTRAYVSDAKLDFAFVGVHPRGSDRTPLARYGHLRLHGVTGKVVRDEFVTIIQHPNGRQKHIAARNNQVRVYVYDVDLPEEERKENAFLYYATDTLKGSSGSPVLSDQWFVVALHRRGVPRTTQQDGRTVILRRNGSAAVDDDPEEVLAYESNEGVRISRILDRLSEKSAEGSELERLAAQRVLRAIQDAAGGVTDGPFDTRTSSYMPLNDRRGGVAARGTGALEVSRRKLSVFPEDAGYDPDFLPGFQVPLPVPEHALRAELAPRTDQPEEFWLPFRHFSTLVHARRRMPVLSAVNIAGHLKPDGAMPNRPGWSYDPRIDEAHQPDDSIFSNLVQRGHMAAREYVYWGDSDEEIKQADIHSFTLSNACPQLASFNGGGGEWFQVERLVMEGSKAEELKVTEFMGPIFRADDPEYDSLRGPGSDAEFGTSIRIPLRFWKIVLWVEDGTLQHRAFVFDQREELEEAGPLELDLEAPAGVERTTIQEIASLTDLNWDGLLQLLG